MTSAVAYYRVSTQRQGRSGLGLEAQRTAVARFAEAEGITLLSEFTEVELAGVPMRSTEGLSLPQRWPQRARQNVRCWLPSSTASRATWRLLPA